MMDLPRTRQSLLVELGKRSNVAWSEFLEVYENAILRYCIRRGLQEADARDAAQLVYVAIQKRVSDWDHSAKGSFRAWLFRVARNISVDLITARSKAAVSGDSRVAGMLSEINDYRETASEEESTIFQLEMRRALFEWAAGQVQHEVQSATWLAFCRTAIEGQKAEDVASQLGVSTGTIYTAKCRVMARIRNKIDQWNAGLPPADALSWLE